MKKTKKICTSLAWHFSPLFGSFLFYSNKSSRPGVFEHDARPQTSVWGHGTAASAWWFVGDPMLSRDGGDCNINIGIFRSPHWNASLRGVGHLKASSPTLFFFLNFKKMCDVAVLDEYYLGICAIVTVGQQVWPNMHTPVKANHLTRHNTAVCDPYKQKGECVCVCVCVRCAWFCCISLLYAYRLSCFSSPQLLFFVIAAYFQFDKLTG